MTCDTPWMRGTECCPVYLLCGVGIYGLLLGITCLLCIHMTAILFPSPTLSIIKASSESQQGGRGTEKLPNFNLTKANISLRKDLQWPFDIRFACSALPTLHFY